MSTQQQLQLPADGVAPSTVSLLLHRNVSPFHRPTPCICHPVTTPRPVPPPPSGVTTPASGPGEVFLVGTGPGDPGLLTLRAAQLMATADVVLYDRLVSDEIMQLVSPAARMVYVGKTAGYHTRRQEEIHELLLAFAEAGACGGRARDVGVAGGGVLLVDTL